MIWLTRSRLPEAARRVQLDAFGTSVGESARSATDALLRQTVRQFDPADPTSPVAKLTSALAQQQDIVTAKLDKNHAELAVAVAELPPLSRSSGEGRTSST